MTTPHPHRWVDEIVAVLHELGGRASLQRIYARVIQRGVMDLSKNTVWKSAVRNYLQVHSSDSGLYRGGPDLFRWVERGVWELRA